MTLEAWRRRRAAAEYCKRHNKHESEYSAFLSGASWQQAMDAERIAELEKCPNEAWECTKIQRRLEAKVERLTKALKDIIEHELYHGVNQGKPSEEIARQALGESDE